MIRAALVLTLTVLPGHADDTALPGLSLSDAQILSRDGDSFRVQANDNIRARRLEEAVAELCQSPATARALFTTDGRHPARITYLIRCSG